ncbi:MAG: hypothetical protein A2Y65_11130 [Deltaproteobacteria bacterium RBG_13_52_11]|nr:MAG: hypothetical protein A2Y65_11130 [Deltaproteobacteria bacterium RBG_13_52_11]
MRRLLTFFPIIFLVFAVVALSPLWGQVKNLSVDPEVTAKIRALDRGFFKGFDVYSAGTDENPTALLFDIKDNYQIADRLWGKPLTEEEVVYAIHRLDDQYVNRHYDIPFEPRALTIVNVKGEVLGYVYTGMIYVLMDRKKDGRITVYLPTPQQYDRGGEGQLAPAVD